MTSCKYSTLNLKQVDGKRRVKQGDYWSSFAYQLLDAEKQVITELDGQVATVKLFKGRIEPKVIFVKKVQVEKSVVKFNIDQAVRTGACYVEMEIGGYVFPSSNSVELYIEQGAEGYEPEPLEKKGMEDVVDLVYEMAQKIDNLDIANDSTSNGIEIPDLLTFYNIAKI